MREVDLEVVQAVGVCDVARQHPAHLRAACAHLGAELHERGVRAEPTGVRIGRIEQEVPASSTSSVEQPQHDPDDGGDHEERSDHGEGDSGRHG